MIMRLFNKAKYTSSLIFYVCPLLRRQNLPTGFSRMIEIGLPSEEKQIGRWQKLLEAFPHTENRIVELVEKYPMHIREIDTTFKLARISAIIRSGNPSDAVHYIEDAIQRDKKSLPILFGKPV